MGVYCCECGQKLSSGIHPLIKKNKANEDKYIYGAKERSEQNSYFAELENGKPRYQSYIDNFKLAPENELVEDICVHKEYCKSCWNNLFIKEIAITQDLYQLIDGTYVKFQQKVFTKCVHKMCCPKCGGLYDRDKQEYYSGHLIYLKPKPKFEYSDDLLDD